MGKLPVGLGIMYTIIDKETESTLFISADHMELMDNYYMAMELLSNELQILSVRLKESNNRFKNSHGKAISGVRDYVHYY